MTKNRRGLFGIVIVAVLACLIAGAARVGAYAVFATTAMGAPSSRNARSQKKHTPPAIIYGLQRGGATIFRAPGPQAVQDQISCDGDGNIYAQYLTSTRAFQPGHVFNGGGPVTGIFPEKEELVRYSLPAITDYQPLERIAFAVSPYGSMYVLAGTIPSEHAALPLPVVFIIMYNHDGTVDSYHRVSGVPGEHFQPAKMAVFADGHFLLSGTIWKGDSPKNVVLGTFAGIFDQDGDFIAPIKLGEAQIRSSSRRREIVGSRPPVQPQSLPKSRVETLKSGTKDPFALEDSTITLGLQDGNIYTLQGTSEAKLYVASPAGSIVHEFHLKPPEPGLSPLQMAPAGVGYLFIYYAAMAGPGASSTPGGPYITVLNSDTGDVVSVYSLPGAASGFLVPACATSPDAFEFLGASKDNHFEVVRYVVN